MFGNPKKDPDRVKKLVYALKASTLNTEFASQSFKKNHAKISDFIVKALAEDTNALL